MRSEDEAVETLRRAHRDAADRLDDAPDARVRAAVLAAAARGVDARPQRVASASSAAASVHSLRTRRWPLSAAALLIVSSITGLVATHVMQDSPERVTTIASSAPVADTPEPGAAAPSPAAPEPSPANAVERTTAPAASRPPVSAPSSPKHATAPRESQSGGLQARADRVTEAKPQPEPAQMPSPTRSAFVAPTPAAAPPPPEQRSKADVAADASSRDAERTVASEPARTIAPAALGATRARIGRTAEPATPEAWVERIVHLRTTGNDAEADRELDGLRRRYPGFAIPGNALAPSGTR